MVQLEHHQIDKRYEGLRVVDAQRHNRLLGSLASHGQQSPVLVVASAEEEGRYVLIDGYVRLELLQTLGKDLVMAVVLDLDEAEALILAHRLDARRTRTPLEEGWLISELVSRHGLSQPEIGERLGRSASWVCRRLALVEQLSERVQEAVRVGDLPAQAAMKYLVPLSRANPEQCEQLVQALSRVPVSVRQVERLYRGWQRANDEVRNRIVANPWLYLKTEAAAQMDALSADDPAAPLLGDLEGICGLAQRARRRVREGVLDELDDSRRRRVARTLEEAWQAFRATHRLLEEGCSTTTPAQQS